MLKWYIGFAWYMGAAVLAACWARATRPATCPRGHRDLYHLGRWRSRVCERAGEVRRLKRIGRGRDLSRW